MTKTSLSMQSLVCVALAALIMSPTAMAECVTECDASKAAACAAGSAQGAGAAGGAGVICMMGVVNIVIGVVIVGEVNQCSAKVVSNASTCEDTEAADFAALNMLRIDGI